MVFTYQVETKVKLSKLVGNQIYKLAKANKLGITSFSAAAMVVSRRIK
jgi:hypothetical protein